ncbi:MAG: hypothetical protein D3906_01755, partial [Candidatus Electrothrix sp. AUS1_2]|nr:hypothetical protein [Candidatus Electrothrix sp. AUS1_2]
VYSYGQRPASLLPARTVTGSASQDWIRHNGVLQRLTLREAMLLQIFLKIGALHRLCAILSQQPSLRAFSIRQVFRICSHRIYMLFGSIGSRT